MLNKLWLNKLEQKKFLKLQLQHFYAMGLSIFKYILEMFGNLRPHDDLIFL